MNADLINGLFELLGGLFAILNVVTIIKDKQSKGVSWLSVTFFVTWGYWNIYFYPTYGLTWSFIGGIVLAFANTIWVILIFYYKYKQYKDIRIIKLTFDEIKIGHILVNSTGYYKIVDIRVYPKSAILENGFTDYGDESGKFTILRKSTRY